MSTICYSGREAVNSFVRANLADAPDVEVLGCPACGGDPTVYDRGVNGSGPYRIQCSACGLRTPESTCIAGPLDTWQGRRGECEVEYVYDWMGWHCKSCGTLWQGLKDQPPKFCKECGRKVKQ